MDIGGPVARRTRSKEAEFFRQYHYENKKKLKETSVTLESVSSGVKKGNGSSGNKTGISELSGGGNVKRNDNFSDIDHRYAKFLSDYIDKGRRLVDERSGYSGTEGVANSGDNGNIGVDNNVNNGGTFENNNGILLPETNLMEDVSIADADDDNIDDLSLETKECVIISDDDEDDSSIGDDNEGANISDDGNDGGVADDYDVSDDDNDGGVADDYDVSDDDNEDETGKLQRGFREESGGNQTDDGNEGSNDHGVKVYDISDDSSDQLESSEMQPESSEDTSEDESESSDEENSEDDDYKEEKSDSYDEELSSDFEEEEQEHLKRRKDVSRIENLPERKLSNTNVNGKEEEEHVKRSKNVSRVEKLPETKRSNTNVNDKEEEEQGHVKRRKNVSRIENLPETKRSNTNVNGKEEEEREHLKRRKSVSRIENLPETKRSNTNVNGKRKSDVSLVRGELNCVARSTRSRRNSMPVGQSTCLDEELDDGNENDYSETNASNDEDQTIKLEREENMSVERKGESSNKETGNQSFKFVYKEQTAIRKRIRGPKTTDDVVKILVDSILEHSETPFEEEKQPVTNPTLPLKFTFGVEESTPPEKSEWEKELDELWHEMAIALCETVTVNTTQVDGAADDDKEVELDRDAHCDHLFVLEEEVGVKCKKCGDIKTEIKHYTVPFRENPFGRSGRRGSFTAEHDTFENFQYHDIADDFGSTRDPNFLKQGTVWDIIPGIDNGMHQHQKEGFEFLWRNIAGGIHIDKLKEGSVGGEGCVISHAPGTGKTRLTIAFLQTYLKQYPLCRAIIIAPCGMLPTWVAEFQKWKVDIPFHNLNDSEISGKENILALKLARKIRSGKKDKLTRMVKLYSWAKDRIGILGMSYRLFEELVGAVSNKQHFKEDDAKKIRKVLFEQTGLLVLDEGHTARNVDSLIWQALSKVRTDKRIILSGTPFQNNFDELFNTLRLARPKFAEKIPFKRHKLSKRRNRWKSEAKEVWESLTEKILRGKDDSLKSQTLWQLKEIIEPFVHIHKGNILQEKLPGLRHSLIILKPCQLQKALLVNADIVDQRYFVKEYIISLLSVHPSLLLDVEVDLEKISNNFDGLESRIRQLRLKPEAGIKTKFLVEFIRLCEVVNERVLVFGQYIRPLVLIMEQLKSQFKWSEGREILCMSGELDVHKRQQVIKNFNDRKSEAKVLLASITACSEGINLVGASRVVLLDVVWNPSVERQAISRAYRLGQERVVHTYHLIASGTMEEEKYRRQAEKERLSDLLFSTADKADDLQKTPSNLPNGKSDKILEHMINHEKLKDMFAEIKYQPKDTNLIESFSFLD